MDQLEFSLDIEPLPSRLVPPQADDPDEIIAELEAIATGLKRTSRHGQYYRAAARLLGFLAPKDRAKRHRLLPAGRALLALSAHEARFARMAVAFEESDCGRAWAQWRKVESLLLVDPATAEKFLRTATTCAAATIERRASTLQSWCTKLLPHHPFRRSVSFGRATPTPETTPRRLAVFAPGDSGRMVVALASTTTCFRVATAFLTIPGYDVLVAQTVDAKLLMLVGTEEACDSVEVILRRFTESIDAGSPEPHKRELIRALHQRLVLSTHRIRYFDPRYEPRLHAKVYIFDAHSVYVTSANLTGNGLKRSIEAGFLVRDRESIEYLTAQFDHYFAQARPLLHQLLSRIERSWVFSEPTSPYLLYLRAMLEIYGEVPELADCTPPPLSEFQRMIVGSVLRALKEQRGVLLVSPTGTGKTVMAAYVAACLMDREIKRIQVFCPNRALKRSWEEHLRQVGQQGIVVTHGIIQRKGSGTKEAQERLAELLRQARDTDLVIIDECHNFRNEKSHGFDSLSALIKQAQGAGRPRLLLLSATPLSKDIRDLNTVLRLLGDEKLNTIDEVAQARSIVNVTLPFIIKQFGSDGHGGRGRALKFGEEYRYFPKLSGSECRYPSSMERVFEHIAQLDLRFYIEDQSGASKAPPLPGIELGGPTSNIVGSGLLRVLLARRAESSPLALSRTIKCLCQNVAKKQLHPVDPVEFVAGLTTLEGLIPEAASDSKLTALVELIKGQPRRRKILIFSMWTSTVDYLEEQLPNHVRPRRLSTITNKLSFGEQQRRIRNFAPLAQKRIERRLSEDIDVLVGTDVIAEGQNLQDAELVINYDLPWTPLLLIQRMGRIDRPTLRPRDVVVWYFLPESQRFADLVDLRPRLDERSKLYQVLSCLQAVGDYERDLEQIEEGDWGAVRTYFVGRGYEQLLDEMLPTTHHLVALAKATSDDCHRARELPVGCRAAKAGAVPGTFAVLRHAENLHCVFLPRGRAAQLEQSPNPYAHEALLSRIAAEPETPSEQVPTEMDQVLSDLVKVWARMRKLAEEEVTIVCAEALVTRAEDGESP